MTFQQIIDVANSRTENRGKKTLQLNYELLTVVQDLCSRKRWFWRKKRYTITTVAGTSTYDLSSSSVIASAGGIDVEEIIKDSVVYVLGPTQLSRMGVIFDEDLQMKAIEDTSTTGEPTAIFIEPGSYQTVRVTPVPAGVYTISFMAWAMPNSDFDGILTSVPLVPKYMHPVLVKGLETQILRYTIGEGAAKFTTANGEYEAGIGRFWGRNGVSGEQVEISAGDCHDAVQST
jgi:hypothetical protein